MPALKLFGRKWLAASDDLVFPCLFEICFRIVWLAVFSCVCSRYWHLAAECDISGIAIQVYIGGTLVLIGINLVLLIVLVNRSAQGAIADTNARRLVAPVLVVKIILIFPEVALNIFGTIWAFSDEIACPKGERFTKLAIEAIVVFNWVLFALIVFGLAIVFDPLGSTKYKAGRDSNDNGPTESTLHRKLSNLWMRRFRWIFCCLKRDEYGQEAFAQVAGLLSALFRGTDLVPSDIMAGCILLRVRQKRETREMRRIRMLKNDGPRYTTDVGRIFATSPQWMNLKNAHHYIGFAMASYGWPMVCYMHCCTGPFRLIKRLTCCACFRAKHHTVLDDNCCLCHVAGIKHLSHVRSDDILYVSFINHVCELPFCVLADHKTKSIVVSIRGSLSLRDIFTDLTANAEHFEAPGMPPDAAAHKGMLTCTDLLLKQLRETNILERSFNSFSDYSLVLTGHSLGAGVAILLGAKLRDKYSDLKVYAFATPAGLLSRDAARCTESFAFTIGVGDDFVMRLSVESTENLRTSVIETIRACKLPKYRIMLNGVGYAFLGVPSRDLEKTWKDVTDIENGRVDPDPLLDDDRPVATVAASIEESALLTRDVRVRRFAKTRLFTGGRILHIVRRKRTELEKKSKNTCPTYEMRWATSEDFTHLDVMPRMLLDHLPDNIIRVLNKILDDNQELVTTEIE